ncbi:NAD-dependent epimerase/dehydratase family protein [Candidatus Pelagibacter sp.]|nr:NAD-dependent epimerase/dehydratase family protein [Candidatus Pelagibacter sp.]
MNRYVKNSSIFLAGHNGLVGSAVLRQLKSLNFKKIITIPRKNLDLTNRDAVKNFFKKKKIDYLVMAAARVGGILANKNYQDEFLLDNINIQNNLLLLAKEKKIKRTIFLGSSCIYPKKSKTPIKESSLLTGKLEKTNECYAVAKIAGIKLSEAMMYRYKLDVVAIMPTNTYGINDNFDVDNSHVIPAMLSKFLKAKKYNQNFVKLYGTGKPEREFIYSDDLASAIVKMLFISKNKLIKKFDKNLPIINVGTGKNVSIKNLALLIKKITKYNGKILFDSNFPDGTFKKNLDSKIIKSFGWTPKIKIGEGLNRVYNSIKD